MKLQGKTAVASRTPWITLTPLAASLLLALAGPAMATESAQTPQLVGNKPVATDVRISQEAPKAGEAVTAIWKYQDDDGDKEDGTSVEWLLDGKMVAGQSGSQYALPADSGGKSLQVRVIPKSAAPAFPAAGDPVSSASVTIGTAWSGPDTSLPAARAGMSWKDANAYCKSINAELPSRAQLIDIWTSNTKGRPTNNEMCTTHNWPLIFDNKHQCGAGNTNANSYWTRNSKGAGVGSHYFVNMRDGLSPEKLAAGLYQDSMQYSVACVI